MDFALKTEKGNNAKGTLILLDFYDLNSIIYMEAFVCLPFSGHPF